MSFQPQDIVRDRYSIIKELGIGGWGITYLAKDTLLPNAPHCVIKEITPSPHLSLEKNRERFEYEANALYSLGNHSQIPQLFARFEQNKKFYLVQEYIEGQNLQEIFNSGYRFKTTEEVIEFLLDILEVLEFVHRQEKIHRDIKPSNLIYRDRDKKIVLIDFGAVKEIPTLDYTKTGEVQSTIAIGTPGYMPPEQRFCSPQCNSDLYALGIVAIRGITGLNPPLSTDYNSETTNSMHIDSSTGEVIWKDLPNSTQLLTIDRDLEYILNKMICYDFTNRYQQAEEVIAELQKLESNNKKLPTSTLKETAVLNKLTLVSGNSTLTKTSTKKIIGMGFIGLILGALLMKFVPVLMFDPKTKNKDYLIDFNEVCNSPIIKGKNFHKYQGKPRHITRLTNTPIWTVFGWKCVFSNQENIQLRGVYLNDYCSEKYQEAGYDYEAYFKNYLDKNSWYCTNVGTKLKPIEVE